MVVAIIAVLLAMLLPTLGRARRKAQGVSCASNLRQLYMASMAFAQDHGGHLPRPHQWLDVSGNPDAARVCVWLNLRPDASGHADFGDEAGVLWHYLEGGPARRQEVITCPGDAGEPSNGPTPNDEFPRNYSYSMNWLICPLGDAARSLTGRPYLAGIPFPCVHRIANRIMWYEENAPGDTWNQTQIMLADAPTGRHGAEVNMNPRQGPPSKGYYTGGRGNYCFFDGHVESLSPGEVLDPVNSWMHRPLLPGDPQ